MSREIFEVRCNDCHSYTIMNLDVSKASKMSFDCPNCYARNHMELKPLALAEESKEGKVVTDGPVKAKLEMVAKDDQSKFTHLIVMRSATSMLPRIQKFSKRPGALVDAMCLQPPLEAFGLRFVRQVDDRIQIYDDEKGLAFQGSFSDLSRTWSVMLSTIRKVGVGFQASLGLSKTSPPGMKPAALVVGKSTDGWFVILDEQEPGKQKSSKEMSAVTEWLVK